MNPAEIRVQPGDIISYMDMCRHEGCSLQRGMNFRLAGKVSVILMSVRAGAPYADKVENSGRTLIYEGHDVPRIKGGPEPKAVDQERESLNGSHTQNGLFWNAAVAHKNKVAPAELVRVYEKIKTGIWAFAGLFELVDAWSEKKSGRSVFKFKLNISNQQLPELVRTAELDHGRLIPTVVKLEVWKRDKGRCVLCGSKENLHFDHVLPYSKGGTSLLAKNIQLLCAKHNLEKRDKIE